MGHMVKIASQTICQNIVCFSCFSTIMALKNNDVTEKDSKFIIEYLVCFLFSKNRNPYGNSRCFEYIVY